LLLLVIASLSLSASPFLTVGTEYAYSHATWDEGMLDNIDETNFIGETFSLGIHLKEWRESGIGIRVSGSILFPVSGSFLTEEGESGKTVIQRSERTHKNPIGMRGSVGLFYSTDIRRKGAFVFTLSPNIAYDSYGMGISENTLKLGIAEEIAFTLRKFPKTAMMFSLAFNQDYAALCDGDWLDSFFSYTITPRISLLFSR